MLPSLLFIIIYLVFFFPPPEFTPAVSEGGAFNFALLSLHPRQTGNFAVSLSSVWYLCALALFPLENGNEEK